MTFDKSKKAGLIELCEKAESLGIEIDPDGFIEDKENIILEKLNISDSCQSLQTHV